MIKNIYYFEEEAKLIIRTIQKNKMIKYTYYDIPYSMYTQIDNLFDRKFEGKVWKKLENCRFEKEEYIINEKEVES
ncbi:MAG TPA: hypothetical protein PLL26_05665 [Candidatus Dojkabacteria bacterium]|nr:hypothetical protein [Candidatus Dojkabacteria bacterium]